MKQAAKSPTRNRPRKKATVSETTLPVESAPLDAPVAPIEPSDGRNVSPLEGTLSLVGGILLVIAALFPRSLKQLLMLSIGGGLVYRGMTGHCGVYQAVGIDTAKGSLLNQINERLGD